MRLRHILDLALVLAPLSCASCAYINGLTEDGGEGSGEPPEEVDELELELSTRTVTVTNDLTTIGTACQTQACPDSKYPLSVAYRGPDDPNVLNVNEQALEEQMNRWRVCSLGGAMSTYRFDMEVMCGRLDEPPQIIEEIFSFNQPNTSKTVEIGCPMGARMLFGGYELENSDSAAFEAEGSYPRDLTTWVVEGYATSVVTARLKVRVLCVREELARVALTQETEELGETGATSCVEVSCREGAYIGGGARWGRRRLIQSAKASAGQTHEVCVAGGAPDTIETYAICLSSP